MPTIEIDHALADTQIDPINFVARGTWNDSAKPNPITCVLKPMSPGTANILPTTTTVDPLGTWLAKFDTLIAVAGQTFTLHARYTGAEPAEEPNIRVRRPEADPGLTINPLPAPMPMPPMPPPDAPVLQDYEVKGTYDPRDSGVGIICMSVTRPNKKIRTIEAAAAAEMTKNGKWAATLRIKPVPPGKKLSIIAIMIDAEGKVVARAGQNSPKAQ